ncbi:MAG: hypothetical protein KGK02_02575 [Rhodospirillales bacterium]|nr:hypothetical protein [Rhodospirillales bacterium]
MGIVGEVLSDPNSSQKIDWINQKKEEDIAKEKVFDKAVIRGGCAIMSLGHYLELYSEDMISEHNYARKVGGIRVDHSSLLHMAMFGASEEDRRTAQLLGYTDEDINSSLADVADDVDFCVLNFVDGLYSTYSRNGSGLRLPIPECRPWMTMNFTDEIHKDDNPALQSVFDALHSGEFQHHDPDAEHFQQILRDILNEIPDRVIIFFLLGPEFYKSREGDVKAVNNHVAFNDVMRSVAAARHRTFLLSATDFVVEPGEQLDNNHFGRMVFYRMAQQIISTVSGLNQLSVQEAV